MGPPATQGYIAILGVPKTTDDLKQIEVKIFKERIHFYETNNTMNKCAVFTYAFFNSVLTASSYFVKLLFPEHCLEWPYLHSQHLTTRKNDGRSIDA